MPPSHFTDATPYQPGTTNRTGKPWLGSSGSPFIFVTSSVSRCSALASRRLPAHLRGARLFASPAAGALQRRLAVLRLRGDDPATVGHGVVLFGGDGCDSIPPAASPQGADAPSGRPIPYHDRIREAAAPPFPGPHPKGCLSCEL